MFLKFSSSPLLTSLLLIGYWTPTLGFFLILKGDLGFLQFPILSLIVSYPVNCQLLLSMLKSHCPLQEKEVVEDLPKEQEEEDVTAVTTSTSQEEVGLER